MSPSRTGPRGRQLSARDRLVSLERVVQRQSDLLEEQRQTVIDLRASMVELGAVIDAGVPAAGEATLALIGPEHVAAQTESLLATGRHIRSCIRTLAAGPGVEETVVSEGQDRIAKGMVQRALYAAEVHDSPAGQRWMRSWADVGEQQRVSTADLVEFAVFDDRAVVVATHWDDPDQGYLLIREPLLIRVYSELFDFAFAAGFAPAYANEAGPDERLLELLGLGLKDEAIARHLGLSLRTVRRRVAALMDQHLVSNRFQLGAATAGLGAARPRGGAKAQAAPRWR